MTNRQARINRLKAAFQKAEELMNEGYIVQWDMVPVKRIDFNSDELYLQHYNRSGTILYYTCGRYNDLSDLTIAEINKELKDRLTFWKKVEIKL